MAQKKLSRQKSVEAVLEEEVKLHGVGFVKEVGFKPGLKERWSYRCTKWWIRRGRSGGWRNRKCKNLYQFEVYEETRGADSDFREKIEHNGRSDQLFLDRMMTVASKSNDGWRASTARALNRDEVMKVWRLVSCENFVGKWEELVFDAFSDPEPVKRA